MAAVVRSRLNPSNTHFPIEPAKPSAGSPSAALLPRAETPAPHRPHCGAGTPSLLAAAIERRTLHPLVEDVKVGPPRVFIYCASADQPRPARQRRFGRMVESVAIDLAGGTAMAMFLAAAFVLAVLATQPTDTSIVTLQAEVRP